MPMCTPLPFCHSFSLYSSSITQLVAKFISGVSNCYQIACMYMVNNKAEHYKLLQLQTAVLASNLSNGLQQLFLHCLISTKQNKLLSFICDNNLNDGIIDSEALKQHFEGAEYGIYGPCKLDYFFSSTKICHFSLFIKKVNALIQSVCYYKG